MEKLSCVLLVDDDKTNNYLNNKLLADMGIAQQVLVAENGQEALQTLKQCDADGCCPDLILLDINMPVMNGFEFLEAYQHLDFQGKQSVVILMLTTSLNPRDLILLEGKPLQGLLNKPLTRKSVQELLKAHFQRELPVQ